MQRERLIDWDTTDFFKIFIYLFIKLCWILVVACGILVPGSHCAGSSVLITGPPEKSQNYSIFNVKKKQWKFKLDI